MPLQLNGGGGALVCFVASLYRCQLLSFFQCSSNYSSGPKCCFQLCGKYLLNQSLAFITKVLFDQESKQSQSVIFYLLQVAYLQQSMGEKQGTSWPGRQSITGQHTNNHAHTHSPKGNLELPINLTGMSLDCGRKPEYLVRTHTCTGRTCKLHAERPQAGN
ncbi:hypothetical protein CHARACLAT_009720 [Characodon lateralis]|uniref:Uncharacterized protein n=1 Tax=Characodon lateralis TaxID=208331 RepID=A0ABU7E8G0_9TELE|nr:hypothetical protein [Characodon lateralis]